MDLIDYYQRKCDQLLRDRDVHQAKIERLEDIIKRKEANELANISNLLLIEKEMHRVTKEYREMEAELDSKDEKIMQLEAQLDDVTNENKFLYKNNTGLRNILDAKDDELNTMRSDIDAINNDSVSMQNLISGLNIENDQLHKRYEQRGRFIENRVKELTKSRIELAAARQEIAGLVQRIENDSRYIQSLEKGIEDCL